MVYLVEVASVGEQENFGGVAEARVLLDLWRRSGR